MTIPKLPFITKPKAKTIIVEIIRESEYAAWLKKQGKIVQTLVEQTGFSPAGAQTLIHGDRVYAGIKDDTQIYDTPPSVEAIKKHFGKDFLKTASFVLEGSGDLTAAVIGWGLACYRFDSYKETIASPLLVWPKTADKKRAQAVLESIYLIKTLINTPAGDLSPQDMEDTARAISDDFSAALKVTKGKPLEKGFPLVHMVGKAAEHGPRLLAITWGKSTHPALTIVGKGVTFDTGGLNIKPTQYMAHMKKDMGGAAHALALGRLVMALKVPVYLRVVIPAVENSIAANAFRPGDIATSRKGITVENTNTDAEGRLILADALTYACESSPDLLIDFATLTGSARAALGPDIPAMFATKDSTGEALQSLSMDVHDPVWRMPLWNAYKKHIESSNADLHNSAGLPGDLMYSALFLKQFVDDNADWVHLDCYAWEHSGKAGRPRGAADTGLLATLALIEDRYA